jgi:hypothetical protein
MKGGGEGEYYCPDRGISICCKRASSVRMRSNEALASGKELRILTVSIGSELMCIMETNQESITKVDKRKDWDICTLDQTKRILKSENLSRIYPSELTCCRDLDSGCTCSRELVGVRLLRSSSPNNCLDDKVSLLPFLNCIVIFTQDTQRRCLQERGERKEKVFWVSGVKNAKIDS